jgi:outer membrane protein OmpA-like peptidoglycan-associated protein
MNIAVIGMSRSAKTTTEAVMVNRTLVRAAQHVSAILRSVTILPVCACLGLFGCVGLTPDARPATATAALSSSGTPPRPDGCAPSSRVVIAVPATSAEPRPALSDRARQLLRTEGERDDACVDLLVGGADAAVAATLPVSPLRNGRPERSQREKRLAANLRRIEQAVAGLGTDVNGLHPLGLMDAAVRRHAGPAILIMLTSGVGTEAALDVRRLGWGADPDQTVATLRAGGWLPDLRGWTVLFVGLGDTAGSQPHLTPPLRAWVVATWLAVCAAGGASSCIADAQLVAAGPPTSTNTVPVVPLPKVVEPPGRLVIPSTLLFALDSADLDASADETLLLLVARIGDRRVRIIGRTDASTGTRAHNQALSLARAQHTAAGLRALDLPAGQIVSVTGNGSDGYSAAEERAHPELVSAHRTVEIVLLPADPHRKDQP